VDVRSVVFSWRRDPTWRLPTSVSHGPAIAAITGRVRWRWHRWFRSASFAFVRWTAMARLV